MLEDHVSSGLKALTGSRVVNDAETYLRVAIQPTLQGTVHDLWT